MHIKFALIANAVIPSGSGKWTIVGTFNSVRARKFPVVHRQIALLIRVEGHHSEAGEHVVRVDFVNELGERVIKEKFEVPIRLNPAAVLAGTPLFFEVVVVFEKGLRIPAAGNYDFAIHVDGTYIESIPLYARKVDEQGRLV